MKNKPKPDDRRDNVERIQFNIDNTIENYRETERMIAITDDEKTRKDLIEKNKRREESLKGMREEIRDEAIAREQGYK
ncbi:small acid-soluble spore protein Tlp [Wansuia hejianensis]|uniref:Protein Tlp homolog n=1 Tax=Wansuia hejianensis TaxID=2763667 RepID=A0A926INQ4_9FIRM|nr:small acid-soluble spore protein Tlp [Wansuia hejianensis]MBC8590923.1 small acid-soluble spore protein Tlp [Wansuia hejianensis]